MPVIALKDRNTLQVRFRLPETYINKNAEMDVVCLLRVVNGSLEINYCHHVIRYRDSASGPFAGEAKHRVSLDAALETVVRHGVYLELWSFLNPTVRLVPSPLDTPLHEVRF